MKTIFAYRIKTARKIKAYSLQTVADKVGISKQMISKYENGLSMPDSTKLIQLANIFEVKPDYFFQPINVQLENVKFRKKYKYSKSKIDSLKYRITNHLENYLTIENILSIKSEFSNPIKNIVINSFLDIEKSSEILRKKWNIGSDPIHSIISLLEANAIKVIEISEPEKQFDGLSTIIKNKYPVIVINKNFEIERKRFTLLHELGHLLLNINSKFDEKEEEKICNRFAGSMLIPIEILYREIGQKRKTVSVNELINFQEQFGISISALVYRLNDLEIITNNKKKGYFIARNQNKHLKEIADQSRFIGKEFSERFERLVYKALSQEIITISKASSFLNIDISTINRNLSII
ncbi:MAG: XRE family transcriptional regulator [Bacteroidota bacterium]|nr:XRE family transcriptional regulator [Bacteroidota bacterium]